MSQLRYLEKKLYHRLLTDFDITSHKYLIQHYLEKFCCPDFQVQGQGHSCYFRKKNSVMVPGPALWTDFDIISYKFNNI